MTDERIDDIEAKIAYQEDTIERLNQAITRQQEMINRLERMCKLLGERISEIKSDKASDASAEPPPPHY